jgi:23S rRNA pseudouridine1911/1915/1917 synthase
MLNRAAGHAHRTAPGSPVPAVVHRLDQDTSGVMMFVKDRRLAGAIAEQFARKTVAKEYLALCVGTPAAVHFTVDAPIARHPVHAPARMLALGGKSARTRCSVVAYRPPSGDRPGAALMRAAPETGRTHQIRLHLAAGGVPIALDPFYFDAQLLQAACGPHCVWPLHMTRQALHAASLAVTHPVNGQRMRFEAPLPADMVALASCLGVFDPDTGAVPTDGSVLTPSDDEAALVAALGGRQTAELDFEQGNCVPIRYRDDPGEGVTAVELSGGEEDEEDDEEAPANALI